MNAACESFLRGGSLNVRRLRQVLSQCLAAFIEAEPEWADKTLPSRTYIHYIHRKMCSTIPVKVNMSVQLLVNRRRFSWPHVIPDNDRICCGRSDQLV